VRERGLVFPAFFTLFASIRGSDLFSSDVSNVVDVPIWTQFVITEAFPGFHASRFIYR